MTTAVRRPDAGPGTATGSASTLTGTGTLARFMLRRDRVRIPAWALGIGLATMASASAFAELYATPQDRQVMAQTMETPAMVAMAGVNYAPQDYTYGVMLGHQVLWLTVMLAGLMSVLLLVRHTRLEESTGRAELVRATVVGRHATTTAALLAVAAANVAVAGALAVLLGASGVEGITWQGSLLYGAAHAAVGLVFAGVAALTVQISEHPRAASGLAIAVIGVAYGVRAVGDLGDGTLSWLSPIGWAQATRVYADDRWWPLLLAVGATAALVAAAFALSARRDVGAGLRRPRPGSPTASRALTTPLGFAVRLHRGLLTAWVIGMFVLGVTYGSVLGEAEAMIAGVDALEDVLAEGPGIDIVDAFAGMITAVMAIIGSVPAVQIALRLRTEEEAGRSDPVLATALSRVRWAASHLTVAAVGGTLVLAAAGLGLGLAGAASIDRPGFVGEALGAALAYVPAMLVAVGATMLLYGLAARAGLLGWAVVGYSFLVVYLGRLLQLPEWLVNLSPFGHVPEVPVEDPRALPLLVLTALAAALVAAGLAAYRARDLQGA